MGNQSKPPHKRLHGSRKRTPHLAQYYIARAQAAKPCDAFANMEQFAIVAFAVDPSAGRDATLSRYFGAAYAKAPDRAIEWVKLIRHENERMKTRNPVRHYLLVKGNSAETWQVVREVGRCYGHATDDITVKKERERIRRAVL